MPPKKADISTRVIDPADYPESITAPRFPGAYPPNVVFAAQSPLGIYHVVAEGANIHGVYFTSRRAKKPQRFASASGMDGAFQRISDHEDKMLHPKAARVGRVAGEAWLRALKGWGACKVGKTPPHE